ncbi:MAG: hypothetical protein WBF90_29680 [Rivularia sp. (in: cyanobacteria)]
MKTAKARFDIENGIAAIITEKNDYKEVTHLNKYGFKLIQAVILGSTVAYNNG